MNLIGKILCALGLHNWEKLTLDRHICQRAGCACFRVFHWSGWRVGRPRDTNPI
jgi:hypothetical protein